MDSSTILAVCNMYQKRFDTEGIPKKRMDEKKFFESKDEMLAHANYLLDGIRGFSVSMSLRNIGKTGRHLGSVQTLLWVAGWYTLEEIMNHNRPD